MYPIHYTNCTPINNNITYIHQPEIPHVTQPYIDDVPVKGLAARYIKEDGEPETIPENPGIRQFVWEHFQDLNCIVQWMKYCGGAFSGQKSILCAPEITILGHQCTINGRLPDKSRVRKIVNWGPCQDLTDMCSFLETIGVCRLFIKNFSHCAHYLVKLTRVSSHGRLQASTPIITSTLTNQLYILCYDFGIYPAMSLYSCLLLSR